MSIPGQQVCLCFGPSNSLSPPLPDIKQIATQTPLSAADITSEQTNGIDCCMMIFMKAPWGVLKTQVKLLHQTINGFQTYAWADHLNCVGLAVIVQKLNVAVSSSYARVRSVSSIWQPTWAWSLASVAVNSPTLFIWTAVYPLSMLRVTSTYSSFNLFHMTVFFDEKRLNMSLFWSRLFIISPYFRNKSLFLDFPLFLCVLLPLSLSLSSLAVNLLSIYGFHISL